MEDLNPNDYKMNKPHFYVSTYKGLFSHLRDKPVKMLELGIDKGGSLHFWRDYFPHGTIAGLDIKNIDVEDTSGRIHTFVGPQQDKDLLDRIGETIAPEGFDIIIDDASHIGSITRESFNHLFNRHLKNGGLYVIEDWGTGYYQKFQDGKKYNGKNHLAGMVGFVKELVDECCMYHITHPGNRLGEQKMSDIEGISINMGQVIVKKIESANFDASVTTTYGLPPASVERNLSSAWKRFRSRRKK